AVIAAASFDGAAAVALRRFYDVRVTEWSQWIADASDRGEASGGTDPLAVLTSVSGPLYYRLTARGDQIVDHAVQVAAEAAVHADAAGVFVRSGTSSPATGRPTRITRDARNRGPRPRSGPAPAGRRPYAPTTGHNW